MPKERGWWSLSTTVEPDDADLEHIADQILQGFTSGEIVKTEDEEETNT